jgi:REP element-mobilizing transposase RayT
MTDRYQNKYRISSARLPDWDYGANGAYFITIGTQNRKHYFGQIVDADGESDLQLNEMGQLAARYWSEIPLHFPKVELANYVVMPNHVHGILIINQSDVNAIPSLPSPQPKRNGGFAGDKNPMFHENISRIVRWYKGRCAFEIHKVHAEFAWQPRFYDHIIRNAESFERIQNYIANNPRNWSDDTFYSEIRRW